MSIKRQVVIEVDDNGAIQSINDLSSSLNENTKEINKNTDAQEDLGKKTSDASNLIKKQNRDVKALDGSIKLLGGALQTTIGSMAVFGISSENIKSIEAATLGSIALANGAKQTLDGIKGLNTAFKEVGGIAGFVAENFNKAAIATRLQSAATRVATGVQAAFNAVMALNPVAIVVISIGALFAAVAALKDRIAIFNKIAEAFNNVMGRIAQALGLAKTESEKYREEQSKLADETEFIIKLKRAEGASEEELTRLIRRQLQARIDSFKAGTEERKRAEQDLKIFSATAARSRQERLKKEIKDEMDARLERRRIKEEERQELIKRAKELSKQVEELGLSDAEKARLRAEEEFKERIKGFRVGSQAYLNAEKLFRAQLAEIQEQEDAEDKAKEQSRLESLQAIRDDFKKRQEDAEADDEIKRIELEKQRTLDELERLEATEEQKLEIIKFFGDRINEVKEAQRKIDEKNEEISNQAKIAMQLAFVDQFAAAFGGLSQLLDQGTAASKAAGLADIAIQTGVGFVRGLQIAQQSAAAAGPGAAFAFPLFYAGQVAAVLNAAAQARNILQSAPGPSPGGLAAPAAPTIPTVGTTTVGVRTPRSPIPDIPDPEPIRAFVLTGEVSDGLEASQRIKNRRTL